MKRNTLWILAVSLFVTELMVAGCAPATPVSTEAPTAVAPAEATEAPTEAPVEAPTEAFRCFPGPPPPRG